MNIHTQQSDCEAEIAAGAWGPDAPRRLRGMATIIWMRWRPLQPSSTTAARTGLDWTGKASPARQRGKYSQQNKDNDHKFEKKDRPFDSSSIPCNLQITACLDHKNQLIENICCFT